MIQETRKLKPQLRTERSWREFPDKVGRFYRGVNGKSWDVEGQLLPLESDTSQYRLSLSDLAQTFSEDLSHYKYFAKSVFRRHFRACKSSIMPRALTHSMHAEYHVKR